MTPNRRIALNIAATYGRSLVALVCGLFSSRWILQALGVEDFGLSAIVGSLVAFAMFVGNLLQVSVARHFAYAIGRGGDAELREWFASALVVHVLLALSLAGIAWPIGDCLVRRFLVVPTARLDACVTLFRLSVVSLFAMTVCIPFSALFTARQSFVALAVFGSLQTIFVFGCSYGLMHYGGDRLIAYGAYMCAGTVLIQSLQAMVAFRRLKGGGSVHVRMAKIREILTFAGWNLFGGGGWLVASRGSDFVTNRFFGPAGNAAYGIAFQLQGQAEALANALVGAFAPAVTERWGAGDRDGSCRLASLSGYLGAVLLALFAIPLIMEMEGVLRLWLGDPPQGAGEACSILLAVSVFNKLTMGQQLAIAADGRIAAWQVVGGIAQMLALPVAVILAFSGVGLRSAALAYAFVFVGCFVSNLYFGRSVAGLSVASWLRMVAIPFGFVTGMAILVASLSRVCVEAGFLRIVLTTVLSSLVFVGGTLIWKRSI